MSENNDADTNKKPVDIEQLMQDVEIRSEAVQEIMGFIPHWIIRWGITVIFAVVFFIILGSYFFKYPDIIPSRITLTTENPPSRIVAKTSGKISALFVRDGEKVQKDTPIAVIESPTDHKHLFELKKKLESFGSFIDHQDNPDNPGNSIQLNPNYSLGGQLQSYYVRFSGSYQDYRRFHDRNYYAERIKATKRNIEREEEKYKRQKDTIELRIKERENSLKDYNRKKDLYNEGGYIPETELDNARLSYERSKNAVEDAKSALSSIESNIESFNQSIATDERNYSEENNAKLMSLTQTYRDLMGQIGIWEHTYLLKADISGKVTFTKYWSVNQNVTMGEQVVTIVPPEEEMGKKIGKLKLPIQGAGKVKKGQKVNIKLDNYPHMDYGMLTGRITSISLIAADNFYTVEVELPNGMVTSYGKDLEFTQEMQGTAEIITEDTRLLERIFKPIKNMLSKMEEKKEIEKEKGE